MRWVQRARGQLHAGSQVHHFVLLQRSHSVRGGPCSPVWGLNVCHQLSALASSAARLHRPHALDVGFADGCRCLVVSSHGPHTAVYTPTVSIYLVALALLRTQGLLTFQNSAACPGTVPVGRALNVVGPVRLCSPDYMQTVHLQGLLDSPRPKRATVS